MSTAVPPRLNAIQQAQATALPWNPLPYMDEWLAELNSAGKTRGYTRMAKVGLSHFATFLQSEGVMHPDEITRMHIVRFQGWTPHDKEWKTSYRAQILKYVRSWINWLEGVGYISNTPWVRIKVPNIAKQPKPLTDDEIDTLFATHRRSAFNADPFTFHRREMILTCLYGWGLRIHELQALNVAQMDTRLEFVTCRNKGGGTKTLPYSPEMKRIFQRWSANRARYQKTGEDALLITRQGERISTNEIYRIVTDLGKQAGMDINPHRLRDTCGTHLLDSDVEVERVMKILGHTNIKQTLAYSKVNNRKVAESHERAMDPRLARLFKNTRDLGAE